MFIVDLGLGKVPYIPTYKKELPIKTLTASVTHIEYTYATIK